MSTAIIRCLFGKPLGEIYWSYKRHNGKPNPLALDILEDSRRPWELEDIHYFVMGSENVKLLEDMGCKQIHLVSDEDDLTPNSEISPLYNKVFLINEAMKMFDEVLYLDFDIVSLKDPDDEMWKIIRREQGKFNGCFKSPVVRTKFSKLESIENGGYRDPEKDDLNFLINTCLVYCNDKAWVENWLSHFEIYHDSIGPDITKHDEYSLVYFLDKEKGVMNVPEVIDNFDTPIVRTHKEIVHKEREGLYFRHKKK